ncbi:MAG: short-chain fatty acyl-CoA regulator family protein [Pseudomonadota bacterium]
MVKAAISGSKKGRKVFLGAQLRHIRAEAGVTQAAFAEALGLSPSYLSQLEHDQRPVSAAVLMRLSTAFNISLDRLTVDDTDRVATELQHALAEPLYEEPALEPRVLQHLSQTAPELARAFLKSHQLNRRYEERLQALDASFDAAAPAPSPANVLPYDEVRDYFHDRDNYVDALDRAGERLSSQERLHGPDVFDNLKRYISNRHGYEVVQRLPAQSSNAIYEIDPTRRTVHLNSSLSPHTLTFQLAAIIGLWEETEAIDDLVERAGFQTREAEEVCRLALANYYAGALILPYGVFSSMARTLRHDIEQLQHHFSISFEQACHRLSNLQRPGAPGVPFFFVRVDRAGNITKRHSATKLQFARFGGGCPLWNVHEAFTVPGRIFVQIAETPDGLRYLSVARSIVKRAGRFDGFDRHYGVALGCELEHAKSMIYADGMDLGQPRSVVPIGVSCRICERPACPQRAFPPIGQTVVTDTARRGVVPYRLKTPSNAGEPRRSLRSRDQYNAQGRK